MTKFSSNTVYNNLFKTKNSVIIEEDRLKYILLNGSTFVKKQLDEVDNNILKNMPLVCMLDSKILNNEKNIVVKNIC